MIRSFKFLSVADNYFEMTSLLSSKSCFKLTTKHFVGVLNRSILDITTNKAGTEAQLFLMSTLFNLLILRFYCIKTTNKVVSMGRGGQKGLNNITNFEH